MRVSGLLLGVVLLILACFVVLAIFPRHTATNAPAPTLDEAPGVVTLAEPVAYCPPLSQTIPHGRVQVLVDSSGSMLGVRQSVIGSLRWVEQGLSRLRDSALVFDEVRLARFDAARGIVTSGNFSALAAGYTPGGQTTLHRAILASRDFDLTFIITDGVAASGTGSGDCAAGVDAACVARAFRDAVHPEQTTAISPQPGIWMMPLWVRHSGIFYTEEPAGTAAFDGAASLQKVHSELGQDVSIANVRADREGNLVFDYTGPRGILLFVIARSDDLGRRAIAALRERMAENNVAAVTSLRESGGPLSAFPPIELYPGYLPRLDWIDFEEAETPMRGTLDVSFGGRRRIAVECAPGGRNEGEFNLTGRWPPRGGRCIDIYQLPAFEFEFAARNARDEASVAAFIAESNHATDSDRENFRLRLQCGEGEQRPCSSDPVPITWIAQSRYDYRADASADDRSSAAAIVRAVATTDLVTQPHRIYGLESLLTIFFEEVRPNRRRIPIADLDLCHGRPEQR